MYNKEIASIFLLRIAFILLVLTVEELNAFACYSTASSTALNPSALLNPPALQQSHHHHRPIHSSPTIMSSSHADRDSSGNEKIAMNSFDILRECISRINAEISSDAARHISSRESRLPEYSDAIEINTIIVRPAKRKKRSSSSSSSGDVDADGTNEKLAEDEADNNVYAIAIVPSTEKVDLFKVSDCLAKDSPYQRWQRWELAPSHLVQDLCGFQPGCVPPLGYTSKPPIRIIADASLLNLQQNKDDQLLIGGGGHVDYRCLLRASSLSVRAQQPQQQSHNNGGIADEIADIIVSSGRGEERFDGGMNIEQQGDDDDYYERRPKPFFPVAPPKESVGDDIGRSDDQLQHRPVPVTAIGRITSARRIAKRLVFADFAPPDYPMGDGNNAISKSSGASEYFEKDMPWRSGEDGRDMYVQLIVGKTFCDALGEEEGPEALKKLKLGTLILVRGAANVDPRQKNGWSNSSGNWAQKRSLDVIVSSFDVLGESSDVETMLDEHRSSLDILPWEVKRRRSTTSDAAALMVGGAQKRAKVPASYQPEAPTDKPTLTLALFDSHLRRAQSNMPTDVILVDTADKVEAMSNSLLDLNSMATAADGNDDPLDLTIGIDCEWRPTGVYNDDVDGNPVALLQIGVPALSKIFLVDVHTLLRPGLSSEENMTPAEALLAEGIELIFQSTAIIKTGFHVATDFRRLAASFPHISAFRRVNGVVELSTFARKVHPTSSRHSLGSLQRLTRFVLGYDVSKVEQCSDWERRPLTSEQMEYAALDCALPPTLVDDMAEGAGRAKVRSILPQCTSSWRFVTMDSSCHEAITLLKAKRVVGSTFAVSQSWLTGKPAPAAPAMPAEGGGPYVDKSGVSRMPSHLVNIHEPANDTAVAWKDMVGKSAGKSKGKCVELVAAHALSEGMRLEFNPRSGCVPFQDGIVLFVNAPSPNQSRRSRFPNEFLDDGRVLTWCLREKDWDRGKSDAARLLGFGDDKKRIKEPAVLFVRSQSDEFICCGKCTVSVPPEDIAADRKKGKSLVKLHLELSSWSLLKDTPAVVDIVSGMAATNESREDEVAADESDVVDVATLAKDSTSFQECLARMVIDGNVIDALGFALEAAKTDPKKRSIAAGIGCLKNVFARSNDPNVLRAVEMLDDAAANLGLF